MAALDLSQEGLAIELRGLGNPIALGNEVFRHYDQRRGSGPGSGGMPHMELQAYLPNEPNCCCSEDG